MNFSIYQLKIGSVSVFPHLLKSFYSLRWKHSCSKFLFSYSIGRNGANFVDIYFIDAGFSWWTKFPQILLNWNFIIIKRLDLQLCITIYLFLLKFDLMIVWSWLLCWYIFQSYHLNFIEFKVVNQSNDISVDGLIVVEFNLDIGPKIHGTISTTWFKAMTLWKSFDPNRIE